MKRTLPLAVAALAAAAAIPAARAEDREGVAVTIYSDPATAGQPGQPVYNPMTGVWGPADLGFGIVREKRRMALQAGSNTVKFTDVAARIDASTVKVRSLTDPKVQVVEQDYQFDLVSADRLLEKHIDRPVKVVGADGRTVAEGTLLSFDGGSLVLQSPSGVSVVSRNQGGRDIVFGELPGGLTTRPTLVWMLHAPAGGEHLVDVAYETKGLSWSADYTAVVSADEKALDLSAWVTIDNRSGGSFTNAKLKLVAGDVHRAPVQAPGGVWGGARMAMETAAASAPPGFEEKAFFEYHLYTLGRPTTLPDRSMKQIELFPAVRGVPCEKVFVYDGAAFLQPWYGGNQPNMDQSWGPQSNPKVFVYLETRNAEARGLGMPLPAGRVRVHKMDDADGSLELVGEDAIDHTPRDEKILLKLGNAFDLAGERKQSAFEADYNAHRLVESFEIRVRNHKKEAVKVRVKERLYRWVNWKLERTSHDFTKQDSTSGFFDVTVPAGGETVVTYTVRYTW